MVYMEVIVTLRYEKFSRDFSLPANVKLKELYPRLLKALQKASSSRFSEWKGVMLGTAEGVLSDPEGTLSEYGICTGMYLNLIEEEANNGI